MLPVLDTWYRLQLQQARDLITNADMVRAVNMLSHQDHPRLIAPEPPKPYKRLLAFDGDVRCTIVAAKCRATASGNQCIQMQLLVTEDDFVAPVIMYKDVPYTGRRVDGVLNRIVLHDFLLTLGLPPPLKSLVDDPLSNGLLDRLTGMTAYVTTRARAYNGKQASCVDRFITRKHYLEHVQAGTARRHRL